MFSNSTDENPQPAATPLLAHWLRLNAVLAFRPQQARELLRRCDDDPVRALRALESAEPVPSLAFARRVGAKLAALGVRALPIVSDAYPEALRRLVDAPPLLFVRGDSSALLRRPVLAIVGSRAATAYGLEVAGLLAEGVARAGAVVVSGLALGIDAASHRGALAAEGVSVAVQARGLDAVYPARHRRLAQDLCARGAVVGELPLGTPPRAPNFPMRNRLISGLASAVLVVEARERSGSLVTARLALDQGLDVFAVPGPITSPTSGGTNRLIQDGARTILCVQDLLDELGLSERSAEADAATEAPPGRGPGAGEPGGAGPREGDAGSAPRAALLRALQAEPLADAELRRRLARSGAAETLERGVFELALFELQLEGRIELDRDGRWRARGSR